MAAQVLHSNEKRPEEWYFGDVYKDEGWLQSPKDKLGGQLNIKFCPKLYVRKYNIYESFILQENNPIEQARKSK